MHSLFDTTDISLDSIPESFKKDYKSSSTPNSNMDKFLLKTAIPLCYKYNLDIEYFLNRHGRVNITSITLMKLYIKYGVKVRVADIDKVLRDTLPKLRITRSQNTAILYLLLPKNDIFNSNTSLLKSHYLRITEAALLEMFIEYGYNTSLLKFYKEKEWSGKIATSKYLNDIYQKPELVNYLQLDLSESEWDAVASQIPVTRIGTYESIFETYKKESEV